jgi:hypothetical protein
MPLALLRPELINKSLVFVKQPTLTQLLILNSVQQESADSLRWIAKVLHRNQRTKRVANEHILDRYQISLGANRSLSENRESSITTPMGSSKWTLPHVVKFYVVVIRSQYFFKVRREPGICIATKYSLCLVSASHEMIVGSISKRPQRFRSVTTPLLAPTNL